MHLRPQKDLTEGWSWYRYSSLAPIIWAALDGPRAPPSLLLEAAAVPGFSLTYIHAKLCFTSGIETLKYQPSKNSRLLPSKWYLRERERGQKKKKKTQYKKKHQTVSHSFLYHAWLLSLSNSKLKKSTMPMSLSLCAQQQNHIFSFRNEHCRNCTNLCFPQCTESWKHEHCMTLITLQ